MREIPLEVNGAFLINNELFTDERGHFFEWYRKENDSGLINFNSVSQANFSMSTCGVIRGMHYSLSPKGQDKLLLCTSGKILDVLIDFRIGSPTFLATSTVELEEFSGKSVFIPSGVGHGFSVHSKVATVSYLLSSEYSADHEQTINPLDPELGIDWRLPEMAPLLSKRDTLARSFSEAYAANALPVFNLN
jgi:dTDP-4-dehydrorhamnose 3,5-epimerase